MTPSRFHSPDLLSVVNTGNYYRVKSCLEKYGLAQNNRENCLVLIEAVKSQNYEIVQLLLSYGCLAEEAKADVFYKSLNYALEDTEMLKILLQAGASIAGKDYKVQTPLMQAMQKRIYPAIDIMLSLYNIDSFDATNENDKIHFCIACIRNNVILVECFIQKGMDIDIVLDNYFDKWIGCTPMYLAVVNLSLEVIEKLLSYGANFVYKNHEFSPFYNAYNIWKDEKHSKVHREKAGYIIDLFLSAHKSTFTNLTDFNGISHFYIACIRNNVAVVESFLLGGADLKIEKGTVSPLHDAVMYNRFEVINILLNHGIKVDLKDSKGNIALQTALNYKCYNIAKLLIKHSANVQIVDRYGYTPIHKVFFHLPETVELLDLMLSVLCNNRLENIKCPGNLSLFHIACARGNARLVENFISLGVIDIDEQVSRNFVINNFNYDGFTALHFAAGAQNLQIIELLLKSNVCIEATNKKEVTALWYALDSQPKYYNINNFIIENFTNELTTNSESVKQKIIGFIFDQFNHIRILKLLLKSGSDSNYKNIDGIPLLFKAYQSVVSSLTSVKINYEKQDFVSEICRRYFYVNSRIIIKLLISHGINRNPRDRKMNSIFHFIIDSMISHEQITELAIEVADLLISSGGNPTLVDQHGDTPLFMAIKNGSVEFVKLLLRYNIDINSADRNLMTPLHTAVQCPWDWMSENKYVLHLKMIEFLLANGSNVDAKDIEGQTPLFKAFDSKLSLEAIKLLLDVNCNVNAEDKYGRTALSVAASRDNPNAVKILLNYGADINIKDKFNNSLLKQVSLSNNNISRVLEVLAAHVYKLTLIGCYVSCENLEILCGYPKLVKPTTICALRKELEALKLNKVDQYTSLCDILFKSVQQMTRHVKNEILENLVHANVISDNFPNYGYMIHLKYQQGIARIQILQKAIESFCSLKKGNLLPESCIDSIFSYMTNKDLENLSLL